VQGIIVLNKESLPQHLGPLDSAVIQIEYHFLTQYLLIVTPQYRILKQCESGIGSTELSRIGYHLQVVPVGLDSVEGPDMTVYYRIACLIVEGGQTERIGMDIERVA
jgi:hypothetical protein